MKEFLEKSQLYEDYLLLENYSINNEKFTCMSEFIGQKFEYFCPIEDSMRPFKLDLDQTLRKNIHSNYLALQSDYRISDEQFINEKLNYSFWIFGECQSCNKHKIHFLLNVYSNNPISNIRNNFNNISQENRNNHKFENTNIYIKKIGCSEEINIEIDKSISKHFDKESKNWLYKAKKLLNLNMGIGSFAYFRRIIEKELIKIIEEIKQLPDSNKGGIQKLLDEYEANPKTYTIYENLINYLPNSLKQLNDNPIQLLYKQTSEGLHFLSEEECLKRSKSIEYLLEFTLRKINEENSELKAVKDVIKNLQ
jgi:hypothetical protein